MTNFLKWALGVFTAILTAVIIAHLNPPPAMVAPKVSTPPPPILSLTVDEADHRIPRARNISVTNMSGVQLSVCRTFVIDCEDDVSAAIKEAEIDTRRFYHLYDRFGLDPGKTMNFELKETPKPLMKHMQVNASCQYGRDDHPATVEAVPVQVF